MEYSSEKYYKDLNGKKVICVDFDNTICLDEWPYIGPLIPGAKEVLNKLKEAGHKLILYTQRGYNYPIYCKELQEYAKGTGELTTVDLLSPAISVCKNNIDFNDVNENFKWELLTNDNSRKIYSDYIIDDHSVGMKYNIIKNKFGEDCKVCDWKFIDKWFLSEELYKESAFSISYNDYLNSVKMISK